ncbi:MAG: putative bifunctional diguanylate cyclase/phosphodiesterase [Gammaproteobacteria bacterium]
MMKTFDSVKITEDTSITVKKIMMKKKLKKTVSRVSQDRSALIKKQSKALQSLQKDVGKLHVFSTQLSHLIDEIPDTILFKDKDGRKLITNKLTKRLFQMHDLDWYGKGYIAPEIQSLKIRTAHKLVRMSLESELDLALEKQQFKLYYQAQVGSDRQMLGAEVLLRWEHPLYGLVTPNQFIPIAEQTGLILPIGAWVLQTACEQLKQWQSDPLKKDRLLAVNISPLQFGQPEFIEQLRQLLELTDIDATKLKLELTESLMLNDISNTVKKMQALGRLGVHFSMDNFGTGYSSLSQLKKLPIDQLKIAHFLVSDIVIDSCDAMIVKTIIDMTRKLGVNLVAGGVETEQQFACLNRLGCTAYQGYLFGKPMPLEEFEELTAVA